jgi:hypothetical protein
MVKIDVTRPDTTDIVYGQNNIRPICKLIGGVFLTLFGGYLLLYTPYDWGGGIMILCGVLIIGDI